MPRAFDLPRGTSAGGVQQPARRSDVPVFKAALVAALLAAAGGVGTGVAVARSRRAPLVGAAPLLDPHTALNRQPLIMAHNVGSQIGQGSVPVFAASQTLPLSRILGETPVRGFELDLWSHQGQIVVNHGGRFVGGIGGAGLQGHLKSLKDWLDQAQNKNEFVVLMIESHIGQEDSERVAGMLDEVFGERIFTPEDAAPKADQAPIAPEEVVWPTPRQLTRRGKRVMVITDAVPLTVSKPLFAFGPAEAGSKFAAILASHFRTNKTLSFDKHTANQAFGRRDLWEDRTMVGRLGPVTPQWNWRPTLDTAQVQALRQRPGIIKLDHVNARDARLLSSGQHAGLGNADMSLADAVYLDHVAARGAAFGAGAALSLGALAFGISAGVLRLRAQDARIDVGVEGVQPKLAELSLREVMALRAPGQKEQPIGAEELGRVLLRTQQQQVGQHILAAGTHTTLSASGALAVGSVLLPPLLSSLSIASLSVLGLGAVLTAVAMIAARAQLAASHRAALQGEAGREALASRAQALEAARRAGVISPSAQAPAGEAVVPLERAAAASVWAGLVSRISASAKYPLPPVARAAWVASGAALFLAGMFDAARALQGRARARAMAGQLLVDTLSQGLQTPRFGRAYARQFNRQVAARAGALAQTLGLSANAGVSEVRQQLDEPRNRAQLEALQGEVLIDLLAGEAASRARGQVLRQGAAGSLKAAGVFWNAATVLPQLGYALLGVAAASLLLGGGITAGSAWFEGSRTRRAARSAAEADPALRAALIDHLAQSPDGEAAGLRADAERAEAVTASPSDSTNTPR